MDIKIYELKKIIKSPVVIFLLVVFNLFNLFIIYDNSEGRGDLKVTRDVVEKFGYKIDNNMARDFKNYYNKNLREMNQITYKVKKKKYDKAFKLREELQQDNLAYNKKELKFFNNVNLLENYNLGIDNIDEFYKSLDIMKIGEGEINKYKLKGKASNTVRCEYKKFNKRFKELVKNKEHKNIFFLNKICTTKGLLFNTLFKFFIFELMILSVLIVGYLVNYEFDNKAQDLIYSTKRGRNLILDKLKVVIIINTILAIVIIGIGLLAYFIIFNHSGLFKVPVSNYFNFDEIRGLPNMCWFNISFIQYLLICIGVIYIVTLLFSGMAFLISINVRNSYIVFFIFSIIFGLGLLGIPGLSQESNAIFINGFNPFMLVMNPKLWFMEGGAFFTFKYYEFITIGVWGTIFIVLNILSIKRFKKTDIY